MRWSRKGKLNVHQLLPSFNPGDAIGNEALALQAVFREWGASSQIYAEHIHPSLSNQAKPYGDYSGSSADVVLFHFSISTSLTSYVKRFPGRKILLYHNATPPRFFRGYNSPIAALLERTREELLSLRDDCTLAMADSEYNLRELEEIGFPRSEVLPILMDMGRYGKSDVEVEVNLKGKTPLFLNVSRIVPSKCIEDIIRIFYYYWKCISPEAWLFLVGSPELGGTYLRQLQGLVNALELEHVVFTGSVSDAALAAYYQSADVFLAMSEHEGFCVPLVEAMFFGVPIVANNACAIPYTLGGSGVLVNKKSIPEISELLHFILDRVGLRNRLVARQKERFECFHPVSVRALLRKHLESVGVAFPYPPASG